MRHALLLIVAFCMPLAAQSAVARDLWGESEMILSDENTPVLIRTVRLNPGTRLLPMPPETAGADARDLTLDNAVTLEPEAIETFDSVGGVEGGARGIDPVTPPAALPQPGHVLTAPPIPGRGAVAAAAGDEIYGPNFNSFDPPDTEEIEVTEDIERGVPDISGVEYLGGAPDEAGGDDIAAAEEVEVARVFDPEVSLPPGTAQDLPQEPPSPDVQQEPRRPPPPISSLAYAGVFSGIGVAEGMRLRLDLADSDLDGWFMDSSGQNFRVDGQLTNMDGRAQAIVISANIPVGYFDLQLTNLGMSALFVPLAEDLTPRSNDARQYEFLRTLSDAALSAIEAERAAREASGDAADTPQIQTGPLREAFPGDEDRRE